MPTYVSFDTPAQAREYIKSHKLEPSEYDMKEVYNKRAKETTVWLEIIGG